MKSACVLQTIKPYTKRFEDIKKNQGIISINLSSQNRMIWKIKEEIDSIVLITVVAQQMFCLFKSFPQKVRVRIRRN